MKYLAFGLKREPTLAIACITKHQYNYKPKKGSSKFAYSMVFDDKQIGVQVLYFDYVNNLKIGEYYIS